MWNRKKAGKIHENIWKDHKMLPIFTTTMCECAGEGKIIYSQLNNRHSPPYRLRLMHAGTKWVHTKSSLFIIRKWNLALDTFFFIFVTKRSVEREREMPQQLKDKWWTNMIRNGNYAIANFRILRIFVHVLHHLPCGISVSSASWWLHK